MRILVFGLLFFFLSHFSARRRFFPTFLGVLTGRLVSLLFTNCNYALCKYVELRLRGKVLVAEMLGDKATNTFTGIMSEHLTKGIFRCTTESVLNYLWHLLAYSTVYYIYFLYIIWAVSWARIVICFVFWIKAWRLERWKSAERALVSPPPQDFIWQRWPCCKSAAFDIWQVQECTSRKNPHKSAAALNHHRTHKTHPENCIDICVMKDRERARSTDEH